MTSLRVYALVVAASLCLVPVASGQKTAARRWAVVVGNNLGTGERPPLRYAEADADRFARVLLEIGNVAPADVTVLEGASADRLEQAFADVRERIVDACHSAAMLRVGGRPAPSFAIDVDVQLTTAARRPACWRSRRGGTKSGPGRAASFSKAGSRSRAASKAGSIGAIWPPPRQRPGWEVTRTASGAPPRATAFVRATDAELARKVAAELAAAGVEIAPESRAGWTIELFGGPTELTARIARLGRKAVREIRLAVDEPVGEQLVRHLRGAE